MSEVYLFPDTSVIEKTFFTFTLNSKIRFKRLKIWQEKLRILHPRLWFLTFKSWFCYSGEVRKSFSITDVSGKQNRLHSYWGLIYKENESIIHNIRKTYIDTRLISLWWFCWLLLGKQRMLNIQTKRGCPYNCIYCSYPIIDGRTVRTLNADKIVEPLFIWKTRKNNYVFSQILFSILIMNIISNGQRK